MAKYFFGYSRYGLELDVPENASKEQLLQAYFRKYGGPQAIFDHFVTHVNFMKEEFPSFDEDEKKDIENQ